MAEQSLTTRLNDILDLFVCGGPRNPKAGRTYGVGDEYALQLEGDNVWKFDSSIASLPNVMPGTENTLSDDQLIRELLPDIRQRKAKGTRFSRDDADSFQKRMLAIPIEKYRVVRPIYGVTLPPGRVSIQLGDFAIHDAGSWLTQIYTEFPNSPIVSMMEKPDRPLVECTVSARDGVKALELADALFYRLELVLRFFVGRRTRELEVGILNYTGPQMRKSIVISRRGVGEGSAWKGALQPLPIGDPFFSSPTPPLAKLLRLVTNQHSDLERHVLRCAEWTAEAMGDLNAASALVKAATALEVMFSANEKGPITPSVMAQIAESCAFLLGNSPRHAVELEREVKRLYGVRSAVVHAGKDSVKKHDLDALIQICRAVVLTILSAKEYEGVPNVAALAERFKAKRYASVKAPNGIETT